MKNTKRNVNFIAITSTIYIIFVAFFNFKFFSSLYVNESFLKVLIFIVSGSIIFLSSILYLFFLKRFWYSILESILLNSLMVFVFSLYAINLINHFLFFLLCIFLGFAFFIILKELKTIYPPIILFFMVYLLLNFRDIKIIPLFSFIFLTSAFIYIVRIFNKEHRENVNNHFLNENRVADFENISAGVFHELMNPLNTIALSIDGIKNEDNQEFRDIAKRSTERAIFVAKKMSNLMLSLKDRTNLSLDKKDVYLQEIVNNVLDLFELQIKNNNISLKVDIHADTRVFCNEILFEQVLTTLISNSIDAVLANRILDKNISISCTEVSGFLLFKIVDTGCGIKNEFKEKVFLPFQTLKNSGTGIGLYSAKNIVEKYLNGSIDFISSEGIGTVFVIFIPID